EADEGGNEKLAHGISLACVFRWPKDARGYTGPTRRDRFFSRRIRTLRPPDHPHPAAVAATAEEPVAAVGLEPRYGHAGPQGEPLHHLAAVRIDPSHVARVALPGAVPELAVDPGDAGDEAVGLDRAQHRAAVRIDLMDLSVAILSDPQGAFG